MPPFRPPTALDDVVSTAFETPVNFDVLANDSDPENGDLTVTILTPPAGGDLVEESDGTLTYAPPAGFTGFQTFTYTLTDSQGLTDEATVTIMVDVTIQLQITEAKGLFTPNTEGIGEYQAAYISADDVGRVYSNRVYEAGDPTVTVWTKNRQYIDLTADLQTGVAALPADARVLWQVEDPDDPSNEDPLAHAEACDTLDPNDYDGDDNDNDGTKDNSDGNDNSGSRDGHDVWEELDAAYALAEGNATAISAGVSRVRFNATDDGGDNFILKAVVRLSAEGELIDLATTGIITTWKRVDVEFVKMASADPLTGLVDGSANDAFAKAFVELVPELLTVPRDVADVVIDLKLQMGVNRYAAGDACDAYVTSAGEFRHEGEPGWFFAASANHFVDTSAAAPPTLWQGYSLVVDGGLSMALPGGETLSDDDRFLYGEKLGSEPAAGGYMVMKTDLVIAQADLYKDGTVLYDYDDVADTYNASAPIISNTVGTAGAGNGAEITYAAAANAADGEILIYKTVVSAAYSFDPIGGSDLAIFSYDNFSLRQDPAMVYDKLFSVLQKGYSTPTQYDYLTFDLYDYGFPYLSIPYTYIFGAGALVVQGISPGPNGGLEGRTMVFTTAGGDLNTLIHEFGHAFGFHHICGNWDYRSDGMLGKCCTMHYSSLYFMLDHAYPRRPDLWTYGTEGPDFCEEHAVAIRRQNLEDLAILNWGN